MRFALLAVCLLTACAEQAPPSAPAIAPAAAPAPAASNAATNNPMPPWHVARTAGVDFRALGQEPGWMLDLYANRLVLNYDYGAHLLETPLPDPTYPVEGQTRYDALTQDGRALRVTIQRYPCQDVMSGENFPARVIVTIDARTLEGCGKTL